MADFDAGRLPLSPPLEPMLAKTSAAIPADGGYVFEPKWDGFRTLVFRDGDRLYLQSRGKKPLLRYFPELEAPMLAQLPEVGVFDGELVVAQGARLDFGVLQNRLHPAKSRIAKLAEETPADFVFFDVLALGDEDLTGLGYAARRARLLEVLKDAAPPLHLTPVTEDPKEAEEWLERYEGAGLDGVIAKARDLTYQPKKRAMLKIKHVRTADCVVAGFRWHKKGPGELLGSLMLGLYDADGALHHVGVTSSFTMAKRRTMVEELAPWREGALDGHPWGSWAEADARQPGMQSRWSAGKDLSWVPLRPTRVCEVKFGHMEGGRFRHTATFVRWREDKSAEACDFTQIEVVPPYELEAIFGR